MLCKKCFIKAFLEDQMSKDKPTPLLAIKTFSFDVVAFYFFTHSHLFLYSIHSLQL